MNNKKIIVNFLNSNPRIGFLTQELANMVDLDIDIVANIVKNDSDFFYDANPYCKGYTGWKLVNYKS